MKHEKYKELLELNILGELNENEEVELQNHLFECEECREEYAELKKMYNMLTDGKPKSPSEQDLINARVRLFNAINTESNNPLVTRSKWSFIKSLFTKNYSLAFGSVVLIIIGLMIGYMIFYSPSPKLFPANIINLDKVEKGDVKIEKINLPQKFSENKEFEFLLNDVQPINYKGNINDMVVQKLLAYALLETENPGFKIKTANAIASQISKDFVADEKMKNAFIQTLKTDLNPGVRKTAIRALINFPYDSEIRDALIFTLDNDENASNRMDAINALLAMKYDIDALDMEKKEELKSKISGEENEVIKYRTAKYLLGGK